MKVDGTRGPRFIFYANELIGLGQLRRTLALAARLSDAESSPSSLVLTGSAVQPAFQLPPRVDTVKLPGRSRDRSGRHFSARLELDNDELRSLRSSIALATATSFQPDVAVVDKLPLGHAGELAPTLEQLKHSGCKLVLGLRDIEDSPRNVRRKWDLKLRRAIVRYYDLILVYGPESSLDAIDCIGQLELDVPIHHVGYVGTPMPDVGPSDLEGDYVLVTPGGGFDGFELLSTFAEAVRLRPLGCHAVIVTGPLMAGAQRRRLMEITAGLDIEVCELRRDMEYVIAGARAVVSMAGYNTVSELMRAHKPALLVPRSGPSKEQLIRARRLAGAGLQEMIHPRDLTPAALRDGLDRLMFRDPPQALASYHGGTERAVEILMNLANTARAKHAASLEAVRVSAR